MYFISQNAVLCFFFQNAVEVEKVTMTKDMLALQATNTELLAKVDSLNKSIETNKKTAKELHVCIFVPSKTFEFFKFSEKKNCEWTSSYIPFVCLSGRLLD